LNQGVIFVFYAGKIEWNRAIYLQYLTYPPLVVFTCSPGVDSLAIINERGEPLKPNCIGEIIIRDPAVSAVTRMRLKTPGLHSSTAGSGQGTRDIPTTIISSSPAGKRN
jgi:hypothetical protein